MRSVAPRRGPARGGVASLEEQLVAVCRAAAEVLTARAAILSGSPDRLAVRDVPEQVTALQQATAGLAGETGELEPALLELRLQALYHLTVLGDSAVQAIAVGRPLVEDAEGVLGPGHPGTLASRNNLALAYQDAGRTANAPHQRRQWSLRRRSSP